MFDVRQRVYLANLRIRVGLPHNVHAPPPIKVPYKTGQAVRKRAGAYLAEAVELGEVLPSVITLC
jgi:hypothetical protein